MKMIYFLDIKNIFKPNYKHATHELLLKHKQLIMYLCHLYFT